MTEDPQRMTEDPCTFAMRSVHAFLHGELPESTADEIRQHLLACERCMDNFDAEQFIGAMLRRCYGPTTAPAALRVRVSRLSLHVAHSDPGD
ncbi:zf-HC2 domain-containing protein [Propionimicrobium sp. PCR01-08-3]|uniref:zf-HC2 domain-containing protein n=1 Tax=Propionimicrobium sp. PCR01-08-3 TaxID=3052086 RepID=UPI00255CDF94|nr:zf-HC2 domain-containing protein [Propionimicrobium sp. PCR01-08-3]WIY83801.1 zf-HC2 domain-containing protein [Propionimicrobium sp. PCR01-08-3]